MLKKSLYFSIIVISLFFLKSQVIAAPVNNELWGWIWTETYGWISLNRYNCDPDRDGLTEGPGENEGNYPDDYRPFCPVGKPVTDYKVRIDETSCPNDFCNVTGYAWSENLGWIDFDPAGPYPMEPDPWQANDSSVNIYLPPVQPPGPPIKGEFFGWARVCSVFQSGCSGALIDASQRGDWDGFIKFSSSSTLSYRVNSQLVGGPIYKVTDWAWSANEGGYFGTEWHGIGWLSFDCLNTKPAGCGLPYYRVYLMRISEANSKPYVEDGSSIITGEEYCGIAEGEGHISFQWIYRDYENDLLNQYHLQLDTDPTFCNCENTCATGTCQVDCQSDPVATPPVGDGGAVTSAVFVITQNPNTICSLGQYQVTYNTSYYWRVAVKSITGNPTWSEFVNGPSFTTIETAYPYPNFSYEPANPKVDENVIFTDLSKCYDGNNNEYYCRDLGSNVFFEWDFDYNYPNPGFDPTLLYDATEYPEDPTIELKHTYTEQGNYTVRLQARDDYYPPGSVGGERMCLEEKPLKARLPAPGWKETAPF